MPTLWNQQHLKAQKPETPSHSASRVPAGACIIRLGVRCLCSGDNELSAYITSTLELGWSLWVDKAMSKITGVTFAMALQTPRIQTLAPKP